MILALCIGWFDIYAMYALSGLALFAMASSGFAQCWSMIRRARVLFILLVFVYAFMTPGEMIFSNWGAMSPTQEGLQQGLLYAWRLLLMLAFLGAILRFLDQMKLLTGIYLLLQPLQVAGIPAQRIAVRIWLTLHYFDTRTAEHSLVQQWRHALTMPAQPLQQVSLELPSFTLKDMLFGMCCAAMLGWALW